MRDDQSSFGNMVTFENVIGSITVGYTFKRIRQFNPCYLKSRGEIKMTYQLEQED
jgi:hypothetical protein